MSRVTNRRLGAGRLSTRARFVTAVPYGLRAGLPSARSVPTAQGVETVSDGWRDAELARMGAELETLTRYADAQEKRLSQLQTALDSRVVIEQAVGMLAERFNLNVADAFELLRRAARNSRRELRALATETIQTRVTPEEITAAHGLT